MTGKIAGAVSAALLVTSLALPVGATSARGTGGLGPVSGALPLGHAARQVNASGNMTYHGGRIEKIPTVYIVYWGWTTDPSGEAPYLEKLFKGLGGSGWNNILTQYYDQKHGHITNPKMVLGGVWYDNTHRIPRHPTDGQAGQEAKYASAHFGYHANADYFIATPHGNSGDKFITAFCAWHRTTTSSAGPIAFTDFPYMTDAGKQCGKNGVNQGAAGLLDGVSLLAGHEYAEVATDPQFNAWWYDPAGGSGEIGDLCEWKRIRNVQLSTGRFAMQPLWSNKAGGCAISL